MIKPQHFALLAVVALASALLAFGVNAYYDRFTLPTATGAPLAPALAGKVNAIGAIEIRQGETTITLERKGADWKLKERNGFPVNAEKARALAVQLAQAALVEPRTQSKERHHLLELEDPAQPGAKSRRVRVLDANGTVLADIVIGKSKWGAFGSDRPGVYVRRNGEAQTWLATGDPKPVTELREWVKTTIFEVDATNLRRLAIEHPGEAAVKLERSDGKDATYKVAEIPAGRKMKANANLDAIAAAFSSLELEDMRPLAQTPAGPGISVMRIEGKDVPSATFRLRAEGDAVWVSMEAQGDSDATRKAAEAINARSKGWEFKLPRWKAEAIMKRAADLFEAG